MEGATNINPLMLRRACESAGLILEEGASKLGLATTQQATSAEKLARLEEGDGAHRQGKLDGGTSSSADIKRPAASRSAAPGA